MARGAPVKIIPSERINLHIPADIKAKLDLHLFSEAEGRIPKGAYSKFFEPILRDYFSKVGK